MSKRFFAATSTLIALSSWIVISVPATAADGRVWRTPSCGCCKAWVDHMKANGFDLTFGDLPRSELNQRKAQLGVGGKFASCHTGEIGGYIIEGHVPASDVQRLLKEKPDAVGLSVPGMPAGSPGMEDGDTREPFDVLLVKKDGTSDVYSRHNQPANP